MLFKLKIIVLFGKVVVYVILYDDKLLVLLCGKCFEYVGILVVVIYYLVYLLCNLLDKVKVWEDLFFVCCLFRVEVMLELFF